MIEGHSLIYLCKQAADNPLVVADEEAYECISIAEEIYEMVIKGLK